MNPSLHSILVSCFIQNFEKLSKLEMRMITPHMKVISFALGGIKA